MCAIRRTAQLSLCQKNLLEIVEIWCFGQNLDWGIFLRLLQRCFIFLCFSHHLVTNLCYFIISNYWNGKHCVIKWAINIIREFLIVSGKWDRIRYASNYITFDLLIISAKCYTQEYRRGVIVRSGLFTFYNNQDLKTIEDNH